MSNCEIKRKIYWSITNQASKKCWCVDRWSDPIELQKTANESYILKWNGSKLKNWSFVSEDSYNLLHNPLQLSSITQCLVDEL
jgi:hypothetical protein